MTIIEMLQQSGILAILGMGIVFLFLIIMVLVINLFGKIINSRISDKDDIFPVKANIPAPSGTVNKPEITAAISAAVSEYRKNFVNSGGKE